MLAPVDIEGAVIAVLNVAPTSTHAATKVPNPRPALGRYIRVTATGGNTTNLIQSAPRVLVEVWGPDETTALNDAQLAWGRLWAAQDSFAGGAWFASVGSSQPVNFPDPDTKSARYQFLSTIVASLQEVSA